VPELERPDGARIHYEVRGEGPLVVLALGFAATPATYSALADDLARDHTVATWDPRGCGDSSHDGPYDITTDAGDLVALVHEIGPPATVFAVGHGSLVGPRARALDPNAISALVSPALVVALRQHLGDTEGFGSSGPVLEMLVEQFRRDPRGSARATIASLNPQYDEDQLRARVAETVAYAPPETTLPRIEAWLEETDALDDLRGFGDRLAMLWYEGDAWQAGSIPRAQELLPEARVIKLEDGTLSRPDLAANVVREMT
jgi:pimeloyl-ACP methyl ester carboxylesterase